MSVAVEGIQGSKADLPVVALKQCVLQMQEKKYSEQMHVYTDGSRDPIQNRTGGGIVIPSKNFRMTFRCADNSSVYSSEQRAIYHALRALRDYEPQKAVIFSDSLSTLQRLKNPSESIGDPETVWEIFQLHEQLTQQGWELHFQWIPG